MRPDNKQNYIFSRSAPATTELRGRTLLVAYKFPPHNTGVAHHRPEALYRYLHEYGWHCDVITAEREGTDPQVVQTVDNSWLRRSEESGSAASGLKRALKNSTHTGTAPLRRMLVQQAKLLLRLLPRWHDECAEWSYGIRNIILATARERGSQLLWTTVSPFSLAAVVISCARELGIPCVIDLRDPLPGYLHFPRGSRHWFYQALARADVVSLAAPCCITPELLAIRRGSTRPEPVVVVSGAWQDTQVPAEPCEVFRLLHAGILVDGGRSPQPLFEAVALLRERHPQLEQQLRMTFIGSDSHVVQDFPGYTAVQNMVEIQGQTPYEQVKEIMATSSMLLIIKLDGDEYSDALPAKMYDYLPYEAPVLSFGMSAGLQGPLLEWSNAGRWLGSSTEIADYIEEQYLVWQRDGVVRRPRRAAALEYLGQRRMAGEFASLFQSVLEGKPVERRTELPWQAQEGVD